MTLNPTSRWCPADYARNAAFVPALGAAALGLLDPQPGEIILDLGCGDGALTLLIEQAGAKVIGLDASTEMVEAARARGVDAYVADAQALGVRHEPAPLLFIGHRQLTRHELVELGFPGRRGRGL